jgi:hypothetical protein
MLLSLPNYKCWHFRNHKSPALPGSSKRLGAILSLSIVLFLVQIYHAVITVVAPDWTVWSAIGSEKQTPGERLGHDNTPKPQTAFGACLLLKDDNDLLYEWIAYHYTVLPLGYLVIGTDLGSTQDPLDVLSRWDAIDDLQYWILQPDDFIHRHGNYYEKYNQSNDGNNNTIKTSSVDLKSYHHHALIDRQKGFLTVCAEFLKQRGVGWTTFVDSDEFVVLNAWSSSDENLTIDGTGHLSISKSAYEIRKTILPDMKNSTVYETIVQLHRQGVLSTACYTTPRLLVGALENQTCPGAKSIQTFAKDRLHGNLDRLSTLRFFQHAKKGEFAKSKFGKVIMDLSQISLETLQQTVPRNIHRPYPNICGPAGGAHFPNSYFFLMHYMGSWNRYASRWDSRRNLEEWEQRAFVNDDMSACSSSSIFFWFPRFVQRIGNTPVHIFLTSSGDKLGNRSRDLN